MFAFLLFLQVYFHGIRAYSLISLLLLIREGPALVCFLIRGRISLNKVFGLSGFAAGVNTSVSIKNGNKSRDLQV